MDFLKPRHPPVSLGTTIVATVYDGGTILAADTRTSLGIYVANRAQDKLTMLADNVCVARSGSAADSQTVCDYVTNFLESHELQLNDQAPVKSAASILQQLVYRNKEHFSAGFILGGHDKYEGASLYEVTLGGAIVKTKFALSGSGSAYIYSWFDKYWRENMSADQAREFVLHAVAHAMARDGSSGGAVRIVMIDSRGTHREYIPANQVPTKYCDLCYEDLARERRELNCYNAVRRVLYKGGRHIHQERSSQTRS